MATTTYRERVLDEIDALQEEYLPYVLQLVQTFREGVTFKPAQLSLKQGWHEARTAQLTPIQNLWDDIDVE